MKKLDNILDIKQQQAAELNEVTEEVQILRQRMRNQEAQVVKQTNTNPLAPPSSVHDMIDSAWRLNKVASIPDQVCRIFVS